MYVYIYEGKYLNAKWSTLIIENPTFLVKEQLTNRTEIATCVCQSLIKWAQMPQVRIDEDPDKLFDQSINCKLISKINV